MNTISNMSPLNRLGSLAIASVRRGNTLTITKVQPSITVDRVLGSVYLVVGVK